MQAREIELSEYKDILLGILVKIDKICRDNNLQYSLCGGTLLGAARHKGYIPWDDDIDIMMRFEDFDKLEDIICSGDYGLNFIYIDRCKDTIYPCGKICDVRTEITQESTFKSVPGYGAFVDVFPLMYFPNNKLLRQLYIKKQLWYRRICEHSARITYKKSGKFCRDFLKKIAFDLTRGISTENVLRYIDKDQRKHAENPTKWMGTMQLPYPINVFDEIIDIEFEGNFLNIIKDFDTALKIQYGDYMQLPPESERVCKHSINCIIKE